jgi:hypothetical protein
MEAGDIRISMLCTVHNVIRKRKVNEEDENSLKTYCRTG